MKLNPVIKELLILIFMMIGLIVAAALFIANMRLEFAVHHPYILANWMALTPAAMLMALIVIYIVKEAFYAYHRKFQNLILLSSLFFEIIILLYAIVLTARMIALASGSVIIYPPLSALHDKPLVSHPEPPSPAFVDIFQYFVYAEIILLTALVIFAVITGKNWNINQRENQIQ
jgi:hypothetical protein